MRNRLKRQNEPFEAFYQQTSDIGHRINQQRTEVAALLARFAILIQKFDVEEENGVKKHTLDEIMKSIYREIMKWNRLFEMYCDNPSDFYESPRKQSKVGTRLTLRTLLIVPAGY